MEANPIGYKRVRKDHSALVFGKDGLSQQVGEFVSEVKAEIGKITWTTKEELVVSTKVVVLSVLFFGIAIYFTDLTIQVVLWLLNFLLG